MQNVFIKKTKNFETFYFRIVFPYEEKDEDIAKIHLLPKMLIYMNEKLPTEEEFKKYKLAHYILSFSAHHVVLGTSGFFVFNLVTVDNHILKDNDLDLIISFLADCIYHPKIINNGFDNFELEREKETLALSIKNAHLHLGSYLDIKIPEYVDDVGIFKRSITRHLADIESLTSQELYQFYQEHIASKRPYIFCIGNINKNQIIKIFNKYFDDSKPLMKSAKAYNHFLKAHAKPKFIEEEKDFKDCSVNLVFKFQNLKPEERYLTTIINKLLTSESTNLLFNKLRVEEGLVYSVDTINSSRFNVFEIFAFTSANNLDKVKNKILEVINDLKKEELINSLLEKLKEEYKLSLISKKNYQNDLLNDVMNEYFEMIPPQKQRTKNMLNSNTKDIIDLVNRMKLDLCFMVKEKNKKGN